MDQPRPEEHPAGEANELYCWMPANDDRECNASCPAFDERSVRDPSITPCTVLNCLKSISITVAKFVNSSLAAAGPKPPSVQPPRG